MNNFEIYLKNLELFEILFYTLIIFLFKNILLVIFRFFQLKYSMEFQKNLSISLLKKILISDLLSVQKDNSAYKFRNIYTEVGWVRKLMLQTADLLTETFIIAGIALTLIFYDPYLVLFSILFFDYQLELYILLFTRKIKNGLMKD